MKTKYISTLSNEIQSEIFEELKLLGLSYDDIERALNSRLCELEDTIDINKFLK